MSRIAVASPLIVMGTRLGAAAAAMLVSMACGTATGPPDDGPPLGSLDAGPLDTGVADQGPVRCEDVDDCRDGDSCTIDECDDGRCVNTVRDLDGDGFAPISCEGGLDCDDDPLTGAEVNPDAEEICDDGIDNNCDGIGDAFDLEACSATNDTCDEATTMPVGFLSFNNADTTHDYALACDPEEDHVDVVFTFEVSREPAVDIEVAGALAIELRRACADAETALGCAAASPEAPPRLTFNRRGLAPGIYHLVVSLPPEPGFFSAELSARGFPPPQRTDRCDESTPIIGDDVVVNGDFVDHRDSYPSLDCGNRDTEIAEEVAFRLRLAEVSDVTISVVGTTDGEPSDVRYAVVDDCGRPNDTALGCGATDDTAANPLMLLDVAAGDYFLLVESDEVDRVGEYALDVTIEPAAP